MLTGDYALGTTIYCKFTTRKFSTGAPFTLAGSPVVSAYENDDTSAITAGITLTVDFNSKTGLNHLTIVATSGNGFESGKEYDLVITTGTVDGVSVVGETIGHFSIEKQSALRPTVAARTLDVTATGAAGIDWGNVENPTTANNLSATNIDTDQVVASVSGAVGSVTGNVGGNVVGSVDSVVDPVTVGTNNDKTGYSIGVGGIASTAFAAGAIDAAALAQSAGQEIADEFLNRNLAGGGSGNTRNVRNALRPSRNRVVIDALGAVTVYEEDDTTPAWTGTATRDAAADPITEVVPT